MSAKSLEPDIFAPADALFAKHRVTLTIGGEPTFVPFEPVGSEWSTTALGPTKFRYARAFAEALAADCLPQALIIRSPGKVYPGELNPRWALHLLWQTGSRQPLLRLPRSAGSGRGEADHRKKFRTFLLQELRVQAKWLRGIDPFDTTRDVAILPLDHDGKRFVSAHWGLGSRLELLRADGAAGLRLPLDAVPAMVSRRALTVEAGDRGTEIFIPPLTAFAFLRLLRAIGNAARASSCRIAGFAGYVPPGEDVPWNKVSITTDPGVIEVNLPPCKCGADYGRWLTTLERVAHRVGLRSFKQLGADEQSGTGGGNHLLLGGPTPARNPFFTRPRWIASLLRYWQHHPSLSYLFTGNYVGPSSQAPRPDESANALYDLEMAYRHLERLPPGDHRHLIGETVRHLHTDASGNTHRSEISFDKFWNTAFDGGCHGLIEFRAIESMPTAAWMVAVAALWRALAAMLLARHFARPLIDHGSRLHDRYFLPTFLWRDFARVLADLRKAGLGLDAAVFSQIFDWRFPVLLRHRAGRHEFIIRKAHEGWPLLCETPLEGGHTSRFVDTSMERLECVANAQFAREFRVYANGRLLPFQPFTRHAVGLGLRYRRTALHPSLHPGIPVQLPLSIAVHDRANGVTEYQLGAESRCFSQVNTSRRGSRRGRQSIAQRLAPDLVTFDLRLS